MKTLVEIVQNPKKKGYCENGRVLLNHAKEDTRTLIIWSKCSHQKYIKGTDKHGKKWVVSIPRGYHTDIVEDLYYEGGIDLLNLSGGELHKLSNGTVEIYGTDNLHGQADHRKVAKQLEEAGVKAEASPYW